jgi:hypothetical protein
MRHVLLACDNLERVRLKLLLAICHEFTVEAVTHLVRLCMFSLPRIAGFNAGIEPSRQRGILKVHEVLSTMEARSSVEFLDSKVRCGIIPPSAAPIKENHLARRYRQRDLGAGVSETGCPVERWPLICFRIKPDTRTV